MADAEESPAQRQARLRREKREKKILSGGNDRLAKITGLSGRTMPPEPSPAAQQPTPASQGPLQPSVADDDNDPDEVDIRSTSYPSAQPPSSSSPSAAGPSEADLRSFLRASQAAGPGAGDSQEGGEPDMMAMLQQLMAGAGGGGGGAPGASNGTGGGGGGNDMPGLPPALAAMLGNAAGGAQPATASAGGATNAYVWTVLHFAAALGLAVYVLATYPFSGTLAARTSSALDPTAAPHSVSRDEAAGGATRDAARIFYLFATAQQLLQSSRFFLETGRAESGMLAKVAGFLPPPWGARVRLVSRYSGIWFTLAGDAMVVVFVLGCVAWWKGVSA